MLLSLDKPTADCAVPAYPVVAGVQRRRHVLSRGEHPQAAVLDPSLSQNQGRRRRAHQPALVSPQARSEVEVISTQVGSEPDVISMLVFRRWSTQPSGFARK